MAVFVDANIRQAKKRLTTIQRKQLPFASALALTKTAQKTRTHVIERLYPNAFPRARNKRFARVLFRFRKATKTRLESDVHQRLERDYIGTHIQGGSRRSFRGGALAVPISKNVRTTATGRTPKAQQPRNLKNSFIADPQGRGPGIWQRHGRGASKGRGQVRLMYQLLPSVYNRRRFPFFKGAERFGVGIFPREFDRALTRALRTAR